MAISLSRYVKIDSTVAGALAVDIQKLVGRRFIDNPLLPAGEILEVRSGGAEEYFGANSEEAKFARQYFAYVSPAPASQAETLQFYSFPSTNRPARYYGVKANQELATYTGITTGSISISINGGSPQEKAASIDLSAAVSLPDVASKITVAISTGSINGDLVVGYNPERQAFYIETANQSGDHSLLINVPGSGEDLLSIMGVNNVNAIYSPGYAMIDLVQAIKDSEDITDNFGSLSFGTSVQPGLDDAKEIARYVAGKGVKYQMYFSVTALNVAQQWYADMQDFASAGLIYNNTANEYKEALPQAIMAATNYNLRNAAVNYMYRQGTFTPDVLTDADADAFDAVRTNYYGRTATAGQNIQFFQRGVLMGGATDPTDMAVHANEQWLKAYLKSRLMSMLISVGRIPANRDGEGMVANVVHEGIQKAIFNGTILIGKRLSELQKVAITQLSGDPLAWHDVEDLGFWMDCRIVEDTVQGTSQYQAIYTLIYSKGDSVRRILGSHSLI